MIIFPNSVVLVGRDVESRAIGALLGLFVKQVVACNPDHLEKETQEILPAEKDGLVAIIFTFRETLTVNLSINLLTFLRLELQWKGRILLIADPQNVQQLEKWDLFQLQRGSEYVAQKCIKRPLMLVDLLAAMSVLRPYSPSAWRLMMNTLQGKVISGLSNH